MIGCRKAEGSALVGTTGSDGRRNTCSRPYAPESGFPDNLVLVRIFPVEKPDESGCTAVTADAELQTACEKLRTEVTFLFHFHLFE